MSSGRASNGTHSGLNENLTIQQGDFLSSGTQMKILVRLAKPLVPQIEHRLLDDRQLPTTIVRIIFREETQLTLFGLGRTIHSNRFRISL